MTKRWIIATLLPEMATGAVIAKNWPGDRDSDSARRNGTHYGHFLFVTAIDEITEAVKCVIHVKDRIDNPLPIAQAVLEKAKQLSIETLEIDSSKIVSLKEGYTLATWIEDSACAEIINTLKGLIPAPTEGEEKETTKTKGKQESQADTLVRLAQEASLFHDEMQDSYAAVMVNGHKEIRPLKSREFKRWLARRFYDETGRSPYNEAIRQALNVIDAVAAFDGPGINLHLRVAKYKGAIWYDLADEAWRAVKITPDGWRVVESPPILFKRFKNTAPQVLPRHGGSLDLLRKYANLKDSEDWFL